MLHHNMTATQARIFAIANPKGGSTKTTSAFTTAWVLGQNGRTLLIDADPQGDSRSWHAALARRSTRMPIILRRSVCTHRPTTRRSQPSSARSGPSTTTS
ncbi:AAA family ATPase [Rhodococcus hoagii]|nr:AAA family ATPase [Prescottella equi]